LCAAFCAAVVLCSLLFNSLLTHRKLPCLLLAENTRASYPIDYIDNAKIPCVGPHPRNVVLLCCDAFGVLPPVSKLSLEQVMYHFISGYTSKVRYGCCCSLFRAPKTLKP
jgi:ATP-dependent phosphoenolpyruvate carboxykinase